MQPYFTYLLIHLLRLISRICYRFEVRWLNDPSGDPWAGLRVVAILNHTSLYEWLFAAVVPDRFIRQLAWHGVVPVAEKTAKRPFVGRFYGMIARHVVPVTRKRDHTWSQVLSRIEDTALVVMLPEGRMKRDTGLDVYGRPMTMKGGIADVLEAVPDGRFLIAYSGGLHHVQHPGEWFPRLFKTIRINFELLDIREYREKLMAQVGREEFREAVKADLQARKDRCCPPQDESLEREAAET
jgi:1-acyl-sn-glycerol-3-phosphate acyltransferase